MTEGTDGAGPATAEERVPAAASNDTVYVIQRKLQVAGVDDAPTSRTWEDIATVVLPPRSRRRPALQKALDDNQITAGADDVFRLLDVSSAEEIPVNSETRLVVG